jgi:ABC-type multidrug transport system fused ATPase/permease subunit
MRSSWTKFRKTAAFALGLARARPREAQLTVLWATLQRATLFVIPLCTRTLIDGIARPRRSVFEWTVAILALGALAQAGTSYLSARASARFTHGVVADLRERMVAHLVRLPVAYLERERAGALTTRVLHGQEGLLRVLVTVVTEALAFAVVLLVALPLLLMIDPVLSVAAIAAGLLFLPVVGHRLTTSREAFHRSASAYAALTSALDELLAGIRVVKGAGREDDESRRYAERSRVRLQTVVAIADDEARHRFLSEAVRGLLTVAMVCLASIRMAHGAASIGALAAFGGIVALLAGSASSIVGQAPHAARALEGLADAGNFLEVEGELAVGRVSMRAPDRALGNLRFERVTFAHKPGHDVLHDVSFDVPAGALIGVVGPSGAGKSTLLDLAARFRTPTAGLVLLDGANVHSLPLGLYRDCVALVGQDVFLFDRSVRENVAYASPDASDDAIRAACQEANAEMLVDALPVGLDTGVGERGHRLSGGERQRLALARALLSDPVVLLLDEVTSNIDPVSEAQIARALRNQRGRRTTIVVAHRLSFIRDADAIVVLEGGNLVDIGTHDELVARPGHYRSMVQAAEGNLPAGSNQSRASGTFDT